MNSLIRLAANALPGEKKYVLFAGAGVSKDAGIPTVWDLARHHPCCGQPNYAATAVARTASSTWMSSSISADWNRPSGPCGVMSVNGDS